MKRLVLTTVLLVSTTVLKGTPEAQQLPKSGKCASHQVPECSWDWRSTFQWTSGTWKFTGIQGNNTFHVTSIGRPGLLDCVGG